MKCPNCGHELSDDETLRFCPRCGRPVDDALSTQEEPALRVKHPQPRPAAQPASFMSYVKHPLPWMGLVLYTLVGVTGRGANLPGAIRVPRGLAVWCIYDLALPASGSRSA